MLRYYLLPEVKSLASGVVRPDTAPARVVNGCSAGCRILATTGAEHT